MMWFAKWFGGRSDQDEEPARVAPAASRPFAPAQRMQSQRMQNRPGAKASSAGKQVNRGFDPYNSGSFDRNQAWNRVIR